MRVGVDATAFGNRHGDGRFARNAVRSLVDLDAESEYVLFLAEDHPGDLPARAEACRLSRAPATSSSRPVRDLVRLARAAGSRGLDAFLFPSLVSWFPTRGIPTVVGVHDANVARFGRLVLPGRRARAAWRLKQAWALRSADRLFTVSESARAELERYLGLARERVEVVAEAPDPVFRPRPAEPGDFVLYASGLNRHKGVETLLDACAELPNSPRLVLVGPLEDDEASSAAGAIRERIERLGLSDRVALPGFVDDEALARLYSSAKVLVVTSPAEGFGLPAVEAAACGAPLLLSDIPAHRENLGGAARYFPPGDPPALARELSALLEDETMRRRLAEQARRRVAGLNWERSAVVLRRLLREAAAAR